MQIFSLRLSGCASSGPLRNRFSERASRRKWGRVFGLRRREGWTKEVSQTAVQCQKDLARLMGNPGIAVIEESCIFPEWACLGTSAVLHLWLRRVYGDCGLEAIVVVDSERQDLRLLVNYAPTTRVLREHFHDCYSLTLMLHRSTSLHWFGEQLPLGTYF